MEQQEDPEHLGPWEATIRKYESMGYHAMYMRELKNYFFVPLQMTDDSID